MTKIRNKVVEVDVSVCEAEVFTTDNESFKFVQTGVCPPPTQSSHLVLTPDAVVSSKLGNKVVLFIDSTCNKTFFFNRDRIRRITTTSYDHHWIRLVVPRADTFECEASRVRVISEDPPVKKSYAFWFYTGCVILILQAIYWAVKFLTPLS